MVHRGKRLANKLLAGMRLGNRLRYCLWNRHGIRLQRDRLDPGLWTRLRSPLRNKLWYKLMEKIDDDL